MSFGFAIRQPDGRLWCSPDVAPMVLHEKIVTPGGWVHYPTLRTTVPKNKPIMIFYTGYKLKRETGYENFGTMIEKDDRYNDYHTFKIYNYISHGEYTAENDSPMNFYIFTTASPHQISSHGLNVYDKNGNLSYSAELIPLQLQFKTRASMRKTLSLDRKATHDFGKRIAVVPGLVYDVTATSYMAGGYMYQIYKYYGCTDGGSVYSEQTFYNNFQKEPLPRKWYGLKNIFYIETEIYDRYLNLRK